VPTKRPEAKQAHAPEIFAIPAEDLREDKKSSQYLPSWDFRLLVPLFSLDAEGTLSMSEQMAKRLDIDIAKIGHVGKNIRILSTDVQ